MAEIDQVAEAIARRLVARGESAAVAESAAEASSRRPCWGWPARPRTLREALSCTPATASSGSRA